MELLEHVLGQPMPSDVDSAAVAGLLDLLRPMGLWPAAVRYGYLFGALETAGDLGGECIGQLATPDMLSGLVMLCNHEWELLLAEIEQPGSAATVHLVEANARTESELLCTYQELIQQRLLAKLEAGRSEPDFQAVLAPPIPNVGDRHAAMRRLIESACSAFFFGDLLRAAQELMAGAEYPGTVSNPGKMSLVP